MSAVRIIVGKTCCAFPLLLYHLVSVLMNVRLVWSHRWRFFVQSQCYMNFNAYCLHFQRKLFVDFIICRLYSPLDILNFIIRNKPVVILNSNVKCKRFWSPSLPVHTPSPPHTYKLIHTHTHARAHQTLVCVNMSVLQTLAMEFILHELTKLWIRELEIKKLKCHHWS